MRARARSLARLLYPGGGLLPGEREVRSEVHVLGSLIRAVRPEFPDTDRRAGPAEDGQLRVPRAGVPRERNVHRVARVKRDVAGSRHGMPVAWLARYLDRGVCRRAA